MTALCAASPQPASPETPCAPGGRDTASWQKALERACTANWFHSALAPLPSRPAEPAASPPGSFPRLAQAFSVAPGLQGKPLHAECSQHAWATATAIPAQQFARVESLGAKVQPPATGIAVDFQRSSEAGKVTVEAPRPASRTGPIGPDLGEAAKVRIHAEACSEGVTVWIGIDGDAALVARRSADLLEELLRQAHATGQVLSAVICNGTPIHGGSPGNAPLLAHFSGDTP